MTFFDLEPPWVIFAGGVCIGWFLGVLWSALHRLARREAEGKP